MTSLIKLSLTIEKTLFNKVREELLFEGRTMKTSFCLSFRNERHHGLPPPFDNPQREVMSCRLRVTARGVHLWISFSQYFVMTLLICIVFQITLCEICH